MPSVLIKRSATTATPASLQYGELAYSLESDQLFIGNESNVPVAIAGDGWLNSQGDMVTTSSSISDLQAATSDIDFGGYKGINVADPTAAQDAMTLNYADSTYLPLTGGTISSDLTVQGNLTVSGTQTIVNSTQVEIGDNIIVLNSGETGTPSQNAGLEIERGTDSNVSFMWDESGDFWSPNGSAIGNVADPTVGSHVGDRDYNDGRYIQQASLTAVGGILYGGTGGAVTELAGNTETTKKFLTQVGDGTNSAAPGWGVLVADDLPVVPVSKGGTGLTAYTAGDMVYADGAGSMTTLAIGTVGAIMQAGAGGVPEWTDTIDGGTF